MNIKEKIHNFLFPHKTKRPIKVDIVFVIFYGVIIWRVSLNLFTNAGFIPLYLTDYHFWLSNILSNIMALFGLVWIFRIYIRSLKGINPIAEEILKEVSAKVPGAKDNLAFKAIEKRYGIEQK